MNNQDTVFLGHLMNYFITNSERISEEVKDLPPGSNFQIKEIGLSLSYQEETEKPVNISALSKRPVWYKKDIQGIFQKSDGRVTVNFKKMAQKPQADIKRLELVIKL